ncbi:3-dehydroquinate synthase II family protein [Micromonospora musae]|uniref:3-dehydroquinate synthase II family protein n=1 Tax=Micromonospora musae TaxID=1894970 RepID=A0A3A9YGR5_9ACTN|nr:3-dehydroquinate synthase II [Micromonospora musae]RKN22133.1 3-dehydroquinate synthase II family protein [Micromonospora musae]RKN33894.1 3-dehydroquinate synthase II family protein [Micromonospora musae]
MTGNRLCWLDIRAAREATAAILEEAVHQGLDAVVASDPAAFAGLPPTLGKVLLLRGGELPDHLGEADTVVLPGPSAERATQQAAHPGVRFGRYVEIVDAPTLAEACTAAREEEIAVLDFRDPTKIPLEIVLAAAAESEGTIVTVAHDVPEAEILFGVLEVGSDGVLMAARSVGDATALRRAATGQHGEIPLVELEVTRTRHVGMGERACVDTCTYFGQDEGILVGSHSKGMVLCVSETHPLPYMPTRPFRVNAGAIHSYTVAADGRTHYLSELEAGSKVLAVTTKGQTRLVTVGRVKIETRPLISIDAVAPNGQTVNLILQDDWHVRVLGPDAVVLNSTELQPGDRILGHLPTADRHVGYPIEEFCREQ